MIFRVFILLVTSFGSPQVVLRSSTHWSTLAACNAAMEQVVEAADPLIQSAGLQLGKAMCLKEYLVR